MSKTRGSSPLIALNRERVREVMVVRFNGNENAAAQTAGVCQRTLNDFMRGRTKRIHRATAQKLAKAWQVPLSDLTGEAVDLNAARVVTLKNGAEVASQLRDLANEAEQALNCTGVVALGVNMRPTLTDRRVYVDATGWLAVKADIILRIDGRRRRGET